MSKRIITVGDTTDHGGVVISGDPAGSAGGRAIARVGDTVKCPHGVHPIVEGSASYSINDVPVALEGHRVKCGCRLIGSGEVRAEA